MTVAIIDYGSGNLRSAAKAFERAADEVGGGCAVSVTSRADDVAKASHIVLPGVGAFAACRDGLLALDGMVAALSEAVIDKGRPFLGICVGMQLMAERGLEHGVHEGLGWIAGEVRAIDPIPVGNDSPLRFRIPHMGWNDLEILASHQPLLAGVQTGDHAYFVHSYSLILEQADEALARVEYGGPITAVVGRDNMVGTQFHPEKSQATGLRLIGNFLNWRP